MVIYVDSVGKGLGYLFDICKVDDMSKEYFQESILFILIESNWTYFIDLLPHIECFYIFFDFKHFLKN